MASVKSDPAGGALACSALLSPGCCLPAGWPWQVITTIVFYFQVFFPHVKKKKKMREAWGFAALTFRDPVIKLEKGNFIRGRVILKEKMSFPF